MNDFFEFCFFCVFFVAKFLSLFYNLGANVSYPVFSYRVFWVYHSHADFPIVARVASRTSPAHVYGICFSTHRESWTRGSASPYSLMLGESKLRLYRSRPHRDRRLGVETERSGVPYRESKPSAHRHRTACTTRQVNGAKSFRG